MRTKREHNRLRTWIMLTTQQKLEILADLRPQVVLHVADAIDALRIERGAIGLAWRGHDAGAETVTVDAAL